MANAPAVADTCAMPTAVRRSCRLWLAAAVVTGTLLLATASARAGADDYTAIRTSDSVRGLAWAEYHDPAGAEYPDNLRTYLSSANRGARWSPARTNEVEGVDADHRLAIDGPGGPGGSVIASSDGGATWHDLPGLASALAGQWVEWGTSELAVYELITDPARPGVVYAIASIGSVYGSIGVGVLESTDGGVTWTAWHWSLTVYRKAELGSIETTWAALPGRDALLLERVGTLFAPGEPGEALERATPAGLELIHTGPAKDAYKKYVRIGWLDAVDVDRSGSRVLLQATATRWLYSTDGGVHLHALALPDASALAFDPSGSRRLFALRDGRLWHSADDGGHWTRRSRGRLARTTGISIDRGGRVVYAFGTAGVSVSRDGGSTFTSISRFLGTPNR
ncbi:MAG: hypothetical protein QOH15_2966 [Gaiellales bacterium]|nr:hypothetical protein [Gaiellales bacterium]